MAMLPLANFAGWNGRWNAPVKCSKREGPVLPRLKLVGLFLMLLFTEFIQ